MNITQDTETIAHIKLVGITAKGNQVEAPTGATLNLIVSSGSAIFLLDSDSKGANLQDSTSETYTVDVTLTGTEVPLDTDSTTITGTVSQALAITLKLIQDA